MTAFCISDFTHDSFFALSLLFVERSVSEREKYTSNNKRSNVQFIGVANCYLTYSLTGDICDGVENVLKVTQQLQIAIC